MGSERVPLPGFEHLLAVLDAQGVVTTPRPAFAGAPRAGDTVLGTPFDPLLAELYKRLDGGSFGDLDLYSFGDQSNDSILFRNERLRDARGSLDPQVADLFIYGKESGEPYYFAVAPRLSSPQGLQPVVYVVSLVDILIYPLASSIDRAFDLWARFCEARFAQYGRLDEWRMGVTSSITKEARLIAQDEELVRMLEGGAFDELVGADPELREWVSSVIQAARSR